MENDIQYLRDAGVSIQKFTDYHYRAFGMIDIYPTTRKVMRTGAKKARIYADEKELLMIIQEIALNKVGEKYQPLEDRVKKLEEKIRLQNVWFVSLAVLMLLLFLFIS